MPKQKSSRLVAYTTHARGK